MKLKDEDYIEYVEDVLNRRELLAFMDWVIDEEGMTTNEERTTPESFVDDYIKANCL